MKSYLTGTAQAVTDSVKRVTELMKGRPDVTAPKPKPNAQARKDFGKRANPKSGS